jgi:Predicted membrane-bound mannosyltransferase
LHACRSTLEDPLYIQISPRRAEGSSPVDSSAHRKIIFVRRQSSLPVFMATLSRDPHRVAVAPGGLDRPLSLAWLSVDGLLFALLLVASIIAHLYGLGRMALHHDESIHAWMSWKFYTGAGDFVCWGGRVSATYCYDPVYHGPSLYVLTLFSYFLFGDGDFQARLPQALAGIALVASTWMLRPYLGARGALLAGVLLAFTPTLLYYTRFARHDGLMVLWTLWIVIGFFRYIDTAQPRYLYLLAGWHRAGAGHP